VTEFEFIRLQGGDQVEVLLRGQWLAASVVSHAFWTVCLLREDGKWSRHTGPARLRWPAKLRRPARLDPVTGNVFADWLEERGHEAAAAALRQAFPVETGDAS
jgi:hypothetical protein